jgi:hypothetical protein
MDKQTRAPTSTTTRPISSNRLYGPSAAGCSIMKAYTSAAAQDLAAVPPCSRVSSQNIFTVIKGRGTALRSARSWTRSCERYVFFEKRVWCHDGPCLVSELETKSLSALDGVKIRASTCGRIKWLVPLAQLAGTDRVTLPGRRTQGSSRSIQLSHFLSTRSVCLGLRSTSPGRVHSTESETDFNYQ